MSGEPLLLSRILTELTPAPSWPTELQRAPFDAATAMLGHTILANAYRNGFGSVGSFQVWHSGLVDDAEYDANLCFLYLDGDRPAAFAQVWTSGFIKDFAIAAAYRRRGIGTALLRTVFVQLHGLGIQRARLKVHAGNAAAIAFYRASGMATEA